jgi:dynein heavy chain, axonemal
VEQQVRAGIESTVSKWVTQVNRVLQHESAAAAGSHKIVNEGPLAEVAFWRARLANLDSVYQQLQDERVHKMALVLSASGSAYYATFTTFFKNVVAGIYSIF